MGTSLNIIGMGQVGRVISQWLPTSQYYLEPHCYNRSDSTFGDVSHLSDLQDAEHWWLTVSDDALSQIVESLLRVRADWRGRSIVHCSGCQSSLILRPLANAGAQVASFHPIMSFANTDEALLRLSSTAVGIEGDDGLVDFLSQLVDSMGANPIKISTEHKSAYHMMSVVSGNFLSVLLDFAVKCGEDAGISGESSISMIKPLVSATLNNALQMSPRDSLSGPFKRLDAKVVQAHVDTIIEYMPQWSGVYQELGLQALTLNSAPSQAQLDIIKAILHQLNRSGAWRAIDPGQE